MPVDGIWTWVCVRTESQAVAVPQWIWPADRFDAYAQIGQRVLGVLFGQPERSFYASELIRAAGTGSGAAQRELAKLEGSGLIAEFSKRARTENAFVTRVLAQPKLWVIGSEHDLPIAA